ncbi:MAG: small subunit ribosomal protein S5 [archaeon GW2011_AR21]|uniref:Small ribosomal subunit protein uS5 n=1 Tax=Candidatus Iainarchaeum sp. TaxID=3101447 RepID=A0A7J4JZE9_9ARCH|nr:MAG: small subunit ribosomal protein S5 [archaeon GW2011_AR21]HIH21257.1 30S ribosomal protein S5 [Candidatus Diapherotrites archaeon]
MVFKIKKGRGAEKSGKKRERDGFAQARDKERKEKALVEWSPKTALGKMVINSEISSFEQIAEKNLALLEPEVIDSLLPDLEEKLVEFRKTTRVTRQGRNFSFRASVLVGDRIKHVAIGVAKDKEKMPAIKKAVANAKLHLVSVKKGCGSWECNCSEPHSIPFKTEGKCASVKVILLPAPKGTGLVCGDNVKDVLRFAGIKDIWCKTFGSTGTKLNFISAVIDALKNISKVKISGEFKEKLEKR